jgi:hypothetical protein
MAAYPVVSAPYGYKPLNLIGGQVFSGSTRYLPIQYNYNTNIFYGDAVVLSRGFITRASIASGTGLNQVTGIFLGCYGTNPTTKQPTYSQYYPANTAAGDTMAIICDDPDTVFKGVMCTSGTTIGSAALAMVGQNVGGITTNAGNANTGDSANALLVPTATPVTTTLPFRIIDVVRDTEVSLGSATYSSISTATVTCSALPQALLVGTDVASLDASTGQQIQSASFVSTAAAAGATSFVLNQAPSTAFVASSTLVFTQYPEVLFKLQFGLHGYYSATATA